MHLIVALCLLLLFVPIYLWKVQGITFCGGGPPPAPAKPYDAGKDAAHDDFVELLRQSLIKYKDSGVRGYTCTFVMHERVNGKLKSPEVIECWFQEEPFSVVMHWKEGASKVAASLYVEGENDGKMCIRPAGALERTFAATVTRKVDCDEAKALARYRMTEFGVRCGTERTYKAWKALKDRGVTLQIEYQGIQRLEQVGRDCHVVKRYCNEPEEEGMTDVTVYLDVETMMQVGSVLKAGNDLIGEYYFKDIKINPNFEPNRFKQEILKQY
jgi:hypothetical protein